MGLISQVLLLPVAPVRGLLWVAERVAEEVEREQYSEGAGVRQLDEIEQRREGGELDEQEAERLQAEVIERQLTRAKGRRQAKEDDGRG